MAKYRGVKPGSLELVLLYTDVIVESDISLYLLFGFLVVGAALPPQGLQIALHGLCWDGGRQMVFPP